MTHYDPERGLELGEELHFSEFTTETGHLSGDHLTELAREDPEAALRIFGDFIDAQPLEPELTGDGVLEDLMSWGEETPSSFLQALFAQDLENMVILGVATKWNAGNENGPGSADASRVRIIETALHLAAEADRQRREVGEPDPPRLDSDDPLEVETATQELVGRLRQHSPQAQRDLRDFLSGHDSSADSEREVTTDLEGEQ